MILEAETIGPIARRAFADELSAAVIAAFDRSFYLKVGGTLIAICAPPVHDGPINIRMRDRLAVGFTSDLDVETGQRWTASPDRLHRKDGLTIDLATARPWQPDTPLSPPDPSRLKAGLDRMLDRLRERHRHGAGLIGLVIGDRSSGDAVERSARPAIDALKTALLCWLEHGADDPAPPIELLGLGLGLTPSGDDLLAGLLISWRHLGENEAADRLARRLLEVAAERTTPISQAHLAAAAEGYGAAPLHRLLGALAADDRQAIAPALDAAAEIGHSSGLDAIAGMVLALKAWLPRI